MDGTNAGTGVKGLRIIAGSSTLRGLVINRFATEGISIETNGDNVIEGNFVGTDVSGTIALGNGGPLAGVAVFSGSNTIGGTTAAARNVISGNPVEGGVVLIGAGATANEVYGNFIGTDLTGTVDLGNGGAGIAIAIASDNVVGGSLLTERNIISGNNFGIFIQQAGATGNTVEGNYIGTDVTGTGALGNAFDGVYILSTSNNTIGGLVGGASNVIAFNGRSGVVVQTGSGNAILSNSIFSNVSIGIDLGKDGVTPNDTGDADTGANNLQNFPEVTYAASGSTIIQGTLNSAASTTFRLEFFSNAACDPSGNGEGETFLGFKDVTTDGSGNASFTANFAGTVAVGRLITATATDPSNNTSEFSVCLVVEAVPTPAPTSTSTPAPVPGLPTWGLLGMAGVMVALVLWASRKNRRQLDSSV